MSEQRPSNNSRLVKPSPPADRRLGHAQSGGANASVACAATSSGDSDSIACLTGAFLGVAGGINIWPTAWASSIEHVDQLAVLGAAWDSAATAVVAESVGPRA